MLAVVMGVVHPQQGGWSIDEPTYVPFQDGKWTFVIRESTFHVFIEGDRPEDVRTFLNEVTSLVQGFLDSLGFHLGVALRAEIKSMVVDGIMLAYPQAHWPELLDGPYTGRVDAADLQPFVGASVEEPLVRLALADLRMGIESPDDTLYFAYRAVESVRQWFLVGNDGSGTARKNSWKDMRTALGLKEPPLRKLENLAMGRRHGASSPPSGNERLESLRLARSVVARFVAHINAQKKPT